MIIFATKYEGGEWIQIDTENIPFKPAAVKCGKWIYDFVLRDLGYSPIRCDWRF